MIADHLRRTFQGCKQAAIALLLAFLTPFASHAVLVAWDPNPPSEGVEGYKIYLASAGATNAPINVGNVQIAPLPNLTPGVQYQIFITAYNAAGESDPSDSLFYTPPAGSTLPSITSQPSDSAVPQGSSIILTVGASGTAPLRYDWTRNGTPIPNSNTNRLVIANAQLAHAGDYQVRISNPLGTVTSRASAVSVVIAPQVTTHPVSRSVLQDSQVSFSVSATGTAPLTYQWQKGSASIPGANSSTYSIPSAQPSHSGQYRVVVGNAAGTATSTSATLDVLSLVQATPPAFGKLLADTNVLVGETITFDPQVSGTEPLHIQWYRFGAPLEGQTGPTLTLGPLNLEDSSGYYAVAANSLGLATSAVAIVTVSNPPEILPPTIVTQPGSLLVNKGTYVVFEVEAVSNGPIFYQWMKNGTNLVNETNSVLTLNNIGSAEEGDYSVLVFNDAGSELSDIAPLRVHALPVITTDAVSVEVAEGGSTTLVGATTSTETTRFQWFKNGIPVPGATNASFIIQNASAADEASYAVAITDGTTLISAPARVFVIAPPSITGSPSNVLVAEGQQAEFGVAYAGSSVSLQWFKDGVPIPGAREAYLVFPSAQYADMATYSVRVSNIAGEAFSTGALLEIAGLPQISAQPQGGTFNERSTFNLAVSAVGAGPLAFQWHQNGAAIAGATNSVLTVSNASLAAQGSYHVTVANAFGQVLSSFVEVQVLLLPRIVEQPASVRVVRGESAVLSVQAEGPGTLEFLWQRNGAPLPGQEGSSIVLESVEESDTGSYYVTVRNAAGQVTSMPASLVVLSPVVIEVPPAGLETPEGQPLTLSVIASGTGPINYQWLKNGLPIPHATNDVLTIASVTAQDSGSYAVRLANELNEITSDPAVITVATAPKIAGMGGEITVNSGRSSFVLESGVISGTGPFAFQWFKNDAALPGATSSNLTFATIDRSAAGLYKLQVSNIVGSVFSQPILLAVRTAPVIAAHPAGGQFAEGDSLNLSVAATGDGPFSYQWFVDGELIPGATSQAFAIASLEESDSGTYTVRVANDVSAVSSAAAQVVVVAADRPRISAQSSNQAIVEGGSAVLSVQASGALPLRYQWFKDGEAIPGATAPNLVFFGITRGDAGSYTVAVENEAGQAISQPIQISIASEAQLVGAAIGGGIWLDRSIFVLRGTGGQTYELEGRRTLNGGPWERLGSVQLDASGCFKFALSSDARNSAVFFRLKQ